jgi:beta-N-acetylhexosaminidase
MALMSNHETLSMSKAKKQAAHLLLKGWKLLAISCLSLAMACQPSVTEETVSQRPTSTTPPTASPALALAPAQPLAAPSDQPMPPQSTQTATREPAMTPLALTLAPDPLAQRVDQLLAEMTLEEKVGQLFLVFFVGPELSPELKEMINEYHAGGILLFNISDNIRSTWQMAQLINDAQTEASGHGARIPLFVGIDQEGGPIVRLTQGATVFPSNMAIGATGSLEDARRMAEVTARELKALGINMNLAPVLDVNNNPDNPVIGVRSFSSSPEKVAQLGVAMIEVYQANGILATAKHFPGHGDTAVDSHVALPIVPHQLDRLEAVEWLPFQAAINVGVDAVMTAHVEVPAVEPSSRLPATLSSRVLQGILRERMGFQGIIVTDSLGMGALDQAYGVAEAAALAFEAGADILAFGADPGHTPEEQRLAYQRLLTLLQSGVIPQSRLDDSVRRILLVKAKYGVLDWKPTRLDQIPQIVGVSEHTEVARMVAEDSITLVRNEGGLLPIGPGQSVLVAWPAGIGDLGGALRLYHPNVQVLQLSMDPTSDEIQLVRQEAEKASAIVIGTVNARRHPGQVQLVDALDGLPMVVVALSEPYDLMSFSGVAAYVATYGDVPASLDALGRVLFGLKRPSGHLPVDLPGLYSQGHGMTGFTAVK